METISALLSLCEGKHWSLVNSRHKGQIIRWANTIDIARALECHCRGINLVAIICPRNTLSILGSSVAMCRYSTIFATHRGWISGISLYCSWKGQVYLIVTVVFVDLGHHYGALQPQICVHSCHVTLVFRPGNRFVITYFDGKFIQIPEL